MAFEDTGLDTTGRCYLRAAAKCLDGLEFWDIGGKGGLELSLSLDFLLDLAGEELYLLLACWTLGLCL